MDDQFTCNSSEGSPQQNVAWWMQPNTPKIRPLDTPIDMIEDFSLGLMSLDESLNLNDKEPADKMFLERENKEAKKRLNTNNYLQTMTVRKRDYQQLYYNGNQGVQTTKNTIQINHVRSKRLKRLTQYL